MLPIRISQKVKLVVYKVPTSGHFFLLKLLLTCFRSFISCDFTHTYIGTLKSSDRSDQRVLPNFYAELRILPWPGIWFDLAQTNFSFINSTEILKLLMTWLPNTESSCQHSEYGLVWRSDIKSLRCFIRNRKLCGFWEKKMIQTGMGKKERLRRSGEDIIEAILEFCSLLVG